MIFSYRSIGIQQFSAKLVLSVYKCTDSKRYHIFLVTFFSWGEPLLVLLCVNYDARRSWFKIQRRETLTKVSSFIFLCTGIKFLSPSCPYCFKVLINKTNLKTSVLTSMWQRNVTLHVVTEETFHEWSSVIARSRGRGGIHSQCCLYGIKLKFHLLPPPISLFKCLQIEPNWTERTILTMLQRK